MSTNYYIRENECTCCNRYDEIHIWRSSMWNDFTFRANWYKYYKNYEEFIKFLEDKKILDEYWRTYDIEDFEKIIYDNSLNGETHHRDINNDYLDSKYINWHFFLDWEFF
jgi:hypothetical protein